MLADFYRPNSVKKRRLNFLKSQINKNCKVEIIEKWKKIPKM